MLPHAHKAPRSFRMLSTCLSVFTLSTIVIAAPPLVGHGPQPHQQHARFHGPADYQVQPAHSIHRRQEQEIATHYGFFGGVDLGQESGDDVQNRLAPLSEVFMAMPRTTTTSATAGSSSISTSINPNPTASSSNFQSQSLNLGPGIVLLPSPLVSSLLSAPNSVSGSQPTSSEANLPAQGGGPQEGRASRTNYNALILACVISGIIFFTVYLFFIMDPRMSAFICGWRHRKQRKPQGTSLDPPQNRSLLNAINKKVNPSNTSLMTESPSGVPSSAPSWKTHRVPPPRFVEDSSIYDTDKGNRHGISAASTPVVNNNNTNNALHFLPSSKFSLSTSGSRDSYASTVSSASTGPPRLSTQGVKGVKMSKGGLGAQTLTNHHDSLHINRRTLGAKLHGLISHAQNTSATAKPFSPDNNSLSNATSHRTSTNTLSLSAVPPPRRPPRPPTADSPALSDSVYFACSEQPYIILTPGLSDGEDGYQEGDESDFCGYGSNGSSPTGSHQLSPIPASPFPASADALRAYPSTTGPSSILLQGRGKSGGLERILTPNEFAELYRMGKVTSRVKRPITVAGLGIGVSGHGDKEAVVSRDKVVVKGEESDTPRSPPGLGLLTGLRQTENAGMITPSENENLEVAIVPFSNDLPPTSTFSDSDPPETMTDSKIAMNQKRHSRTRSAPVLHQLRFTSSTTTATTQANSTGAPTRNPTRTSTMSPSLATKFKKRMVQRPVTAHAMPVPIPAVPVLPPHLKSFPVDDKVKVTPDEHDEGNEEEEGSSFQNSNVTKRIMKHRRSRSASGWAYPTRKSVQNGGA